MKSIFKNKLFLIGFIILVIGSGPLIVTMLAANLGFTSDPNPNPVWFGMMAMFTFWPGLALMVIGLFASRKKTDPKD